MRQETLDFLTDNGYRMWKEKVDSIGVVQNYQKRVDSQYPNAPLCSSNEKLFINITYYSYHLPDNRVTEGFEIYLVHGIESDIWCDLKIYPISEQQMVNGLRQFEDKLIEMWKIFCNSSEEVK